MKTFISLSFKKFRIPVKYFLKKDYSKFSLFTKDIIEALVSH